MLYKLDALESTVYVYVANIVAFVYPFLSSQSNTMSFIRVIITLCSVSSLF